MAIETLKDLRDAGIDILHKIMDEISVPKENIPAELFEKYSDLPDVLDENLASEVLGIPPFCVHTYVKIGIIRGLDLEGIFNEKRCVMPKVNLLDFIYQNNKA